MRFFVLCSATMAAIVSPTLPVASMQVADIVYSGTQLLSVVDESSNVPYMYTGLVARYVLAGKCSDAGLGFSPEQVEKMGEFIKSHSQAVAQAQKDEVWEKVQSAYNGRKIAAADCNENIQMSRYLFPASVFQSNDRPKNPF